jgi:hypothetical protein
MLLLRERDSAEEGILLCLEEPEEEEGQLQGQALGGHGLQVVAMERVAQAVDHRVPGVLEGLLVDFVYRQPGEKPRRIRGPSPVNTKRGAEEHERNIRNALQDGSYERAKAEEKHPAPTLEELSKDWLEEERLRKQKHSTVVTKRSILRLHILPLLGKKRPGEVSEADVRQLRRKVSL